MARYSSFTFTTHAAVFGRTPTDTTHEVVFPAGKNGLGELEMTPAGVALDGTATPPVRVAEYEMVNIGVDDDKCGSNLARQAMCRLYVTRLINVCNIRGWRTMLCMIADERGITHVSAPQGNFLDGRYLIR